MGRRGRYLELGDSRPRLPKSWGSTDEEGMLCIHIPWDGSIVSFCFIGPAPWPWYPWPCPSVEVSSWSIPFLSPITIMLVQFTIWLEIMIVIVTLHPLDVMPIIIKDHSLSITIGNGKSSLLSLDDNGIVLLWSMVPQPLQCQHRSWNTVPPRSWPSCLTSPQIPSQLGQPFCAAPGELVVPFTSCGAPDQSQDFTTRGRLEGARVDWESRTSERCVLEHSQVVNNAHLQHKFQGELSLPLNFLFQLVFSIKNCLTLSSNVLEAVLHT